MEINDEGRTAVSTQRQEFLAERDIVSQLQEHLAETQVDDWSLWYDQEYGSEYEMVQEEQEDEGEAAEVNQVQPVIPAPQNTQPPTQPRMEQPISKPKLNIKGGDPTTLTRIINEWIQKTAIALNTWSLEASNFWNQSVNSARQQHNGWLSLAPQNRATHIGLPTSFQALPTQVPVLAATMRAELINSVLPEKVTSMAMLKGALKVHELPFLTFQAFLPSEPSARVDGLNTVETPLKSARNFGCIKTKTITAPHGS